MSDEQTTADCPSNTRIYCFHSLAISAVEDFSSRSLAVGVRSVALISRYRTALSSEGPITPMLKSFQQLAHDIVLIA